jgi:hypothetical protein
MARFSQMSKDQLMNEIKRLEQEYHAAEKEGWEFQAAMLQQKIRIARSYLIDPSSIQIGKLYEVEGQTGKFLVKYLNGVMAWGSWEGSSEEVALPLAVLGEIQN